MILFGIFVPQLMIEVMIQWTLYVRNWIRFFGGFSGMTWQLAGDFNEKLWRYIFKPQVGNKKLHESSNGRGIRVVNFSWRMKFSLWWSVAHPVSQGVPLTPRKQLLVHIEQSLTTGLDVLEREKSLLPAWN